MKKMQPNEAQAKFHKVLRAAVVDAVNDISLQEVLAITSHLVGQLIAAQDQTKYTREMVMSVVYENIVAGNGELVNSLLFAKPQGTA